MSAAIRGIKRPAGTLQIAPLAAIFHANNTVEAAVFLRNALPDDGLVVFP
jgi:hypothetical protein